MLKNNAVVLKLYRNGMIVFLNEEMSYEKFKKAVVDKFKKSEGFFQGATPNVGFKGIELDENQCEEIIKEISEILNCDVSLWENPSGLSQSTEEKIKSAQSLERVLGSAFKIDVEDSKTKFYNKTLRSGQALVSDGHAVVIGDVNPGAEVVAAGNVLVMGTVKGIVHAGAKGDREAIVVALNLSPTQLRIADIISRAPDDDVNFSLEPEIAYINNNQILIEDFLQKRK